MRRFALAFALLACGLSPAIAHAEVGPAGNPELSARLSELVKPAVRAAPHAVQDARLSLPRSGPGSLVRRGNRVLVNVRFAEGFDASAGAGELAAAGAEVVHVSAEYQTVAAFSSPGLLPGLGALAGVEGVNPALAPIAAASNCHGLVTSEGDAQLGASSARNAFNVEGDGVTVGILSDSFDTSPESATTAEDDVAGGDLPGPGNPCDRTDPVEVLEDFSDTEEPTFDEGRGMAQIVHDLAPGADLAFATAYPTEFAFAENIRRLASPPQAGGADAEILVDDIAYLEEPFFQDGPVGAAIEEVTGAGVSYFTAAGNDNLIDEEGNDIASWETPEFRGETATCPLKLKLATEAENCLDFDPSAGGEDPTFGITVEPDETLTVDLQWAEPRFGVKADLDVFLLDEEDKPIPGGTCALSVAGSCDNNVAGGVESTEQPVEIFGWENESSEPKEVRLAVNRCFGSCNPGAEPAVTPRVKFALLENGGGVSETEYPKSAEGDIVGPTIFGHAGTPNAISVGAVPFNDSGEVEPYSSHGPVTHYFGTAKSELTAPLAEPLDITKPDLVATDCGLTTFFVPTQTPGINRFCGTSAAAPHAAAVAALMRSANPTLTNTQIWTALAASARPVGSLGPDVVGAGLVNANDAVGRVALPPEVEITEGPASLSSNPSPRVAFAASRPVTFFCSIDEGVPIPCSSPFVPATPLEDGEHTITVSGTDLAGRSGSSEPEAFAIDTTAPETSIRKHPKKVVRTTRSKVKLRFRFVADEPGATFLCRIDGSRFRECPAKLVRKFKLGKHRVQVKARDQLGNVDGSAAGFSFRVERR